MKSIVARICYVALACAYACSFGYGLVGRAGATPVSYQGEIVNLTGDDVVTSSSVNIGFTFNFYGTDFSTIDVSTNGVAMFDTKNTKYSNTALPSNVFAHAIFPFWDDLATDSGIAKSIYSKTIGDAGSRKFVLQWTNHNFCCGTGGAFGTIQVILYEGSNKIHMQYLNLIDNARAKGTSATIGIQKNASTANQYSLSDDVLSSDMAIEYTPDNSGGYTDNGHLGTFEPILLTVANTPGAPTLTSPANNATGISKAHVTFRWTPPASATHYRIAIATDPLLLSDNSSYDSNIPRFTLPDDYPLNTDTLYYWRVVAFSSDNVITYSSIQSFTSGSGNNDPDSVADFGPTAMINGSVVDVAKLLATPFTFAVSDTDTSDTVGYEVIISTSTNPDDGVIGVYTANSAQGARTFKYGQTAGTYFIGSSSTKLVDGASYYVLVRAVDNHNAAGQYNSFEGPSFVYESTPGEDGDNISAATEDLAPNDGDSNGDGFPDSWQANVTSVVNTISNSYSTLEASGCDTITAVGIQTAPADSSLAGSYNYPAGLMNFTLSCASGGDTATVTQYFYGISSANLVARKYNSTTNTYTVIEGAVISDVTIGGKAAVKVVYTVKDGGPLDQDGQANGVIVDPSGVASFTATVVAAPNTGIVKESMYPYIFSSIAGLGTFVLLVRRKNIQTQLR